MTAENIVPFAPDQAGLPEGFTCRGLTRADAQQAADLFNAHSKHFIGVTQDQCDDVISEWETPGFNVETDSQGIFSPQGMLVGYGDVWDTHMAHVNQYSYVVIHPDFFGRGLGIYLQAWTEERAKRNIVLAPSDARVLLLQYIFHTNQPAAAFLEQRGFTWIRSSRLMRADLTGVIPEPEIPDGIVIQGMNYPDEIEPMVRADIDAFKDHWGFADEPFESSLKRWKHQMESDPSFDPSLFFLARAGEEIAGVCLCLPQTSEDPDMGWVRSLGVRRAWRQKGLGLGLLRWAFRELANRKIQRVGLTVDSQSLTGATRLYERAGMQIVRQYDRYEKELRAGIELRTMTFAE